MGSEDWRDSVEQQRAGRVPEALAERVRRLFLQPQEQDNPWRTGMRKFCDDVLAEEIPPSAALFLLCDLTEDWGTTIKQAVLRGFFNLSI